MKIVELKPSKRVKGRWLAVLEDGAILRVGESEIADFALYAGRELSEEEAVRLTGAARSRELKEKALALLAGKPLSRRELERKLQTWEASPRESEEICLRMEELGYLNDAAYAAQIVRHYSAKGFGEKKLRDELYRRGVPRELWEEALARIEDNSEAIDAFVAKKLAGRVPDRKELGKVSAALARRGFHWQEISEALDRYAGGLEEL